VRDDSREIVKLRVPSENGTGAIGCGRRRIALAADRMLDLEADAEYPLYGVSMTSSTVNPPS
jgi:hypothetical protein